MIFKLTPAYKDYIWGGTKLKNIYGKKSECDIVAESWELSCHKNGESRLADKTPLTRFLAENKGACGTACSKFSCFPLLVKLIDAAKDLSVQVHPSDAYAKEKENQLGKTEMWYVLSADEGASLYCGFKNEIDKQQYENAIKDGTLCDLLNKVPVKKGDMFFIEAGTIHAIGAGIVIAEIQQSSDVTYRVYDYKRKGADGRERELHVEKALEVTNLKAQAAPKSFGSHLAKCEYFTVDKVLLNNSSGVKLMADESSFKAVLALDSSVDITACGQNVKAEMGETVFVCAATGEFELNGNGEALVIYVE